MSVQELFYPNKAPWLNTRVNNQQVDGQLTVVGDAFLQGNVTVSGSETILGPVNLTGPLSCPDVITNIITPTEVPNTKLTIQSNGGSNDYVDIQCNQGLHCSPIKTNSIVNTGDLYIVPSGNTIIGNKLLPVSNNNYDIGDVGNKWANVRAENIVCGNIKSDQSNDPLYIQSNGGTNDFVSVVCADGLKSDKLNSFHTNSNLELTADGTGHIQADKDIIPDGNTPSSGATSLGSFAHPFYYNIGRIVQGLDQVVGPITTNSIGPQATPTPLNLTGYSLGGVDFGLSQVRYHNVKMTDYLSNGILVNTSSTVYAANTKTVVNNYSVISGTLPGFNPTTGLYTLPPNSDGVYGLQIQIIGSFGVLGSSDLIVYIEGGSGTVQVGNTMRMAPDGSSICYGYQSVNLVLSSTGYNNFRIAVYPKSGSFTGTVGFAFGILYNI